MKAQFELNSFETISNALPNGITMDQCVATTWGDIKDRVSGYYPTADDAMPAWIVPGWEIDEDGHETHVVGETLQDAMEGYLAGGDYGQDGNETVFVDVGVSTLAIVELDGDVERVYLDRAMRTCTIDPAEPSCIGGHEHDWQAPHEVLGDSGGVQSHGGSAVCTTCCAHCGAYRIDDGWAVNPSSGESGYDAVTYREADATSLAWVAEREAANALYDDCDDCDDD